MENKIDTHQTPAEQGEAAARKEALKGMKLSNEYARAFGEWFDKTPKAVFAAIVWSYTSTGGDCPENGLANFANEWRILHENGIVPQPLPSGLRSEAAKAEMES